MTTAPSRTRPVVAIDGPAGAGKSTVARRLAQRLGFLRLDTGALYRAVALSAVERGVSWDDEAELGALASGLDLEFRVVTPDEVRIFLEGKDRSDAIRTPRISLGASQVSQFPAVRQALLDLQRRVGESGGVVAEGRDIGTVVFPDAEVKVFLTADPRARAQRRVDELRAQGLEADLEHTLAEVQHRDHQDSVRAVAPMKPAPDAVHVDTTGLGIEDVVDKLESLVRAAWHGS